MTRYCAPNGREITGTLERVTGRGLLAERDDDGEKLLMGSLRYSVRFRRVIY